MQKTKYFTVNPEQEKERIKSSFADDLDTRDHLLELMDLIEQEKWEQAYDLLGGLWWRDRDPELECPRYEFIGNIESMGPWYSYLDLIKDILFSVDSKTKTVERTGDNGRIESQEKSKNDIEQVARAICMACEENPDHIGDARGNEKRWQDYIPVAEAAIEALNKGK